MKRIVSNLAGGVLMAAALGVQAQTPAQMSEMQLKMDRGFYVGFNGGGSRMGVEGTAAPAGCACAVPVNSGDSTDRTWGVFAGYQFNKFVAVEAGWSDFGTRTSVGTVAGVPVAANMDSTAFDIVGVVTLPITDRFHAYGKAGIYRSSSDSTWTGAVTGSGSETDNGFTLGIGMQYWLGAHAVLRLEWQSYADVGTGVIGLAKEDMRVWRLGGRFNF